MEEREKMEHEGIGQNTPSTPVLERLQVACRGGTSAAELTLGLRCGAVSLLVATDAAEEARDARERVEWEALVGRPLGDHDLRDLGVARPDAHALGPDGKTDHVDR